MQQLDRDFNFYIEYNKIKNCAETMQLNKIDRKFIKIFGKILKKKISNIKKVELLCKVNLSCILDLELKEMFIKYIERMKEWSKEKDENKFTKNSKRYKMS